MSLAALAKNDVLRVAINTGNSALVQVEANVIKGVSPSLAKRLADEIGMPFEFVIYPGAGKVFADADNDKWDVGFLAIDAQRAERIAFTRPYITIEATYAVRTNSGIADIEDVDRPGIDVLTASGSAYDMHLTNTLEHARLERFGTPPESFEAFRNGRCDAVAGVRESLARFFGDDPGVRILPGVLTSVQQAMVLPGPNNPNIEALDDFVRRAIEDGFVENAIAN